MASGISDIVDPSVPSAHGNFQKLRSSPLFSCALLAIAVSLGFALQRIGPVWLSRVFEPAGRGGIDVVFCLLAATVTALIVHESGHLLAALFLRFEVLGFLLGPVRVSRLHGKYTVRVSGKRLLSGSISAIPRDTESWRGQMLIVISAGPLMSLIGSFAAAYLVSCWPAESGWRLFFCLLTQISIFIFVLGLIPNGAQSAMRNDAQLFLSLLFNGRDAVQIDLYNRITRLKIAGIRPKEYPESLIRMLAAQQGRPDTALLFAETIVEWAVDTGRLATADAWDRHAFGLSQLCTATLAGSAAMRSACFDVLFRDDITAAQAKFERTDSNAISMPWLRYRTEAARCLAKGQHRDVLAKVARAAACLPCGVPYAQFEEMLLGLLQQKALAVVDLHSDIRIGASRQRTHSSLTYGWR
jgi:MFS family permease